MQQQHSTDPVGFIGLGTMGAGMARNVLNKGHSLTVTNRSRPSVDAIVGEGAQDGITPAGVAQKSKFIILCLPDSPDVERVLFGPNGVADGASANSVVIDCSSISATDSVAFRNRLLSSGVEMIDAPVSGGRGGAEAGTLSCMVGGETSVVDRCCPILETFAKSIVHVGGPGAGQICKICNQICQAASMLGAAEAVALCMKSGVDPLRVREALLGGSAQSKVLENHLMRLIQPTSAVGFRSDLMYKDLRVAVETMQSLGVFSPTTAVGEQLFRAYLNGGNGREDWPKIGNLHQNLSGLNQKS